MPGAVGLCDDGVLGVSFAQFVLVEQRVQLDLVDRRRDECEVDKVFDVLRGEVGHADRSGMALSAGLNHASPGVHILAHGGAGQ